MKSRDEGHSDMFRIDAPDYNKPAQHYQEAFAQMFGNDSASHSYDKPMIDHRQTAYDSADKAIQGAMELSNGFGVAPLVKEREDKKKGSKTFKALNPDKPDELDKLPLDEGFVYMTHLFNINNKKKKEAEKGKGYKGLPDAFIFTDQPEAVKTAIEIMGIQTDKNPGGVPIDFNHAMKVYFGDDDKIDDVALAEWKTKVEQGDSTIDPKRVRKFTNYDGSITWEILNADKTVANRFTIGNYKGTKVFAQGGYQGFLDLMKKARKELGDSTDEFDWLRNVGKKL